MKVSSKSIWSVLIELIRSGELTTMPFVSTNAPSVGFVVCFEAIEGGHESDSSDWVYVQVTGDYDYYDRGATIPCDGMSLIKFKLITCLADLIIE